MSDEPHVDEEGRRIRCDVVLPIGVLSDVGVAQRLMLLVRSQARFVQVRCAGVAFSLTMVVVESRQEGPMVSDDKLTSSLSRISKNFIVCTCEGHEEEKKIPARKVMQALQIGADLPFGPCCSTFFFF